ncbi:MAG: hypothetical protein HOQ46_23375, partial [Saccharothrix sp.]|nr:hypothetical protein [Saccharothrix sp.]
MPRPTGVGYSVTVVGVAVGAGVLADLGGSEARVVVVATSAVPVSDVVTGVDDVVTGVDDVVTSRERGSAGAVEPVGRTGGGTEVDAVVVGVVGRTTWTAFVGTTSCTAGGGGGGGDVSLVAVPVAVAVVEHSASTFSPGAPSGPD